MKGYIEKCSQKTTSMNRKEKTMAIKNTSKRVDKKVFKRTAAATKKINVSPKTMRGGIRL